MATKKAITMMMMHQMKIMTTTRTERMVKMMKVRFKRNQFNKTLFLSI